MQQAIPDSFAFRRLQWNWSVNDIVVRQLQDENTGVRANCAQTHEVFKAGICTQISVYHGLHCDAKHSDPWETHTLIGCGIFLVEREQGR